MDSYGVNNTCAALQEKMRQYIRTVYLGQNTALRDACEKELSEPQCLSQTPYIEANPAYKSEKDGIANTSALSKRPELQRFYKRMIDQKLGVFKDPYLHQVMALDAYYSDKDLIVATGTGSGKTECFMWPIAGKLYDEAYNSPDTWKMRGVRALMLYPMNALVSDQLGRLRRMLGDHNGSFEAIFAETHGRRPQFGMYTGRTPYAGEACIRNDKDLASTLRESLIECDEKTRAKLIDIGKYPAKVDFEAFVTGLSAGLHTTDLRDAEMLTRVEMRETCPDILITNYSMLEYMLVRPLEQKIWDSTKAWLNANASNKLLFVIDEAHMYRGSSGGEVALLIRRLMHRLGIERDRVQFILTTASVPDDDDNGVLSFAKALSGQSSNVDSFELIRGTEQPMNDDGAKDYPARMFCNIDIDSFYAEGAQKIAAIKRFGEILALECEKCDFNNERSVEVWLYEQLLRLKPIIVMLKTCRGKATKLDKLAKTVFPFDDAEEAVKATNVLLAVAPLAKSADGNVLFPARLHLMFRGLNGIYACANPSCKCAAEQKNLPIGKVSLTRKRDMCACGGKVYELWNERTCGALFFRGYLDLSEHGDRYVWTKKSINLNAETIRAVDFFIMGRDEVLDKEGLYGADNIKSGWINAITGRLYTDDSHSSDPKCLHVAYSTEENKNHKGLWTFRSCPKCGKKNISISNFVTKGNEPFFNLVSEQLSTQPQTIFNEEELKWSPNKGRKVLLFSDSRQKAAILAKELTRAADEDAMKKALTVAAKKLQDWASEDEDREATVELLYGPFLEVALEHNLRFFYGEDEGALQHHVEIAREEINECKEYGWEIDYQDLVDKTHPIPGLYYVQFLKQVCSNFRSLTDAAFCWIEPSDKQLKKVLARIKRSNLNLDRQEFMEIFAAWACDALTDSYAIGLEEITNGMRENAARRDAASWGIEDGREIPKKLKMILNKKKGYDDAQIDELKKHLMSFTGKINDKSFLNTKLITLKYQPYPEREWYICPRCKKVFPYTLWGTCAHCFKATPTLMSENDVEGLKFWRDPVLRALAGDKQALMTGINAEEHTAQLSHKDQLDAMWSTTENFEMRFQNVFPSEKNRKPVDVLSCTTTMEVGIDIGSLTAVGLRNIPPMRENYQQRAGRAGRRGASVSSIVTYIDDSGPHDNFYFKHPERIISGKPRTPWIDNNNKKLVSRHLNIVSLIDYLKIVNSSLDTMPVDAFLSDHLLAFTNYLQHSSFGLKELKRLVPTGLEQVAKDYKVLLIDQLNHMNDRLKEYPERYKDNHGQPLMLLDALYLDGVMPTYSFPKDVVGFYVEDSNGDIKEKPERSLDMAINEYAPGRTLVINKRTYKSGGLYNHHSRVISGAKDNPAEKYLRSDSEYLKTLYLCTNKACQWFSTERPKDNTCPFCGSKPVAQKRMIKPWGFAPLNGKAIKESEADNEASFSENPCYAATPDDQMEYVSGYFNVKVKKRADQELLIINRGVNEKGFVVCQDCGAAASTDDEDYLTKEKVLKPYTNPASHRRCAHSRVLSSYLGTDVRTDMAVFEFALDNRAVNTSFDNPWLKQAAITLAEAMVLAAGRLLDVEFNEIRSGYRVRYDRDYTYLDVFLFDSLSSGAGYCALVADKASLLLKETYDLLSKCTCETTCHDCLNHFWNQRIQGHMDRFAALDILNWCMTNTLPRAYTYDEMIQYATALIGLFSDQNGGGISIEANGSKLLAVSNGTKKEIYIYPSMWRKDNCLIPSDAISVSKSTLMFDLPKAYSAVLNGDPRESFTDDRRTAAIIAGTDLQDEDYSSIWEYILDECESLEAEERIKEVISAQNKKNKRIEKPIHAAIMRTSDGEEIQEVDWVWKSGKVVLLTAENERCSRLLCDSDWTVFNTDESLDIELFLKMIEVK